MLETVLYKLRKEELESVDGEYLRMRDSKKHRRRNKIEIICIMKECGYGEMKKAENEVACKEWMSRTCLRPEN